jgi:hypothetical protein
MNRLFTDSTLPTSKKPRKIIQHRNNGGKLMGEKKMTLDG